MSASVTVRKVESKADFKAFFEFPWTLYRDDPSWVPPLLSMRHDQLDRTKNPSWEYMEGDYFLAWRGERPVGTITAFVNHRHNQVHDEHIGWFGTFEVEDDAEAATALLDTASQWLRQRGYDAMRGPASFTANDEIGVLVENFGRPILLMPYNPPYYDRLVTGAGLHRIMDLGSWTISRAEAQESGLFARLERLTTAIMKRSNVTVRSVDPKNKKADFRLFKELYNTAWEKNWGFVPMTERELDAMVASLGQFLDTRLAFFAFVNGDPAGFVLPVPDFNQVLQRVGPRPRVPEVVSLLKALYHWKLNPVITWVRAPLFGVREEYRKKGIDAVLLYHGLRAILENHYQNADAGWILETNQPVISVLKTIGMKQYKTHRLYEKSLAGG